MVGSTFRLVVAAGLGASGGHDATAQDRQIAGQVVRAAGGQPIAEAAVSVVGTSAAVRTGDL